MNLEEIVKVIAAEGCNLLPDVAPNSKPKIFAIVGHPDPMPNELLIKLRYLASKGVTVVFLRDDEDLIEFQKMADLVLVDSLPLPEPSDLERINKEFILMTHEHLLIDPESLLVCEKFERNHFVPRHQRIPANCRISNRNVGLNRRIMRK